LLCGGEAHSTVEEAVAMIVVDRVECNRVDAPLVHDRLCKVREREAVCLFI
jgi:hypothetical protein